MDFNALQNELNDILNRMAENRMIFSKEIQFQFALATELQKIKGAEVLFENLSVLNKNGKEIKIYTDLILRIDSCLYPIELKYKTADKKVAYQNTDGNVVYTFNQGAVESGSYDFIKDVERIELLLDSDPEQSDYTALGKNPNFKGGFAILLTNYDKYYVAKEQSFYWENYHLLYNKENPKRIDANKELKWIKPDNWKNKSDEDFKDWLIKNCGKERADHPIKLTRPYTLQWKPYDLKEWKEIITGRNKTIHNFMYLLISVPKDKKN